jgi:hypothetical protein
MSVGCPEVGIRTRFFFICHFPLVGLDFQANEQKEEFKYLSCSKDQTEESI